MVWGACGPHARRSLASTLPLPLSTASCSHHLCPSQPTVPFCSDLPICPHLYPLLTSPLLAISSSSIVPFSLSPTSSPASCSPSAHSILSPPKSGTAEAPRQAALLSHPASPCGKPRESQTQQCLAPGLPAVWKGEGLTFSPATQTQTHLTLPLLLGDTLATHIFHLSPFLFPLLLPTATALTRFGTMFLPRNILPSRLLCLQLCKM